ncbi:hypothetical protein HYDPIDRAFT_104781 [Hydnomerulius pinastri MD-312]|nr:hypothetical protein HYDPIDRAFT_104781 [Hydnomerulius pinastri MD-312]
MALNNSPRKIVPLASGDDSTPRKPTDSAVTKRVFYCAVVVEGCEGGKRLSDDVQDLVLSLGDPWLGQDDNNILPSATDTTLAHHTGDSQRKRAITDSSALSEVINELVNTERSYVKRLRTLKNDYADPLRQFSRSKSTAILPAYEAKTLFGNVDNLLPVNEAFLTDLEKMVAPNGSRVGGVGDVALRHFKDLRGFEHYKQYYVKREEAQSIFEREMMKKSSGFAAYIDRIKYSNAESRNRVGLRELLMDPVQRIPRYTLLFRTMVKLMGPDDPQRAKLIEADEIASKIAHAETDDHTRRAAVMYCLSATIDGFPAGLISNSRRFIDCIDVDDIIVDAPMGASSSASSLSATVLHCTLLLFDDKLVIVKRPGNGEKSGRSLAGLDEVEKLAKTGGLPLGMKKSGLSCKGVVDLCDIVAADVGDAEFHVYLENPPQDQGDRWSARPFRSLSVVFPPAPINLDPARTATEKERFLENLWSAQAKYRTRAGQSVVLCADEKEVESRGGRTTVARTYFNVYQRTAFLQESKKTKIVMHIDPQGTADPLPFGMAGPPYVVVRVQPMAGEISRYSVTSSDPIDEPEEDIMQTARIPGRIVQTIQQYGLFKFKTGNDSRPATPTASARSRAHIFSLDAISRNLFNALPGSSKGDLFGASINSHRRSKSSASRSSIYTQTTTTADGSLAKFSYRSNSTATGATSLASGDDDSFSMNRSASSRRKLVKRGRSPGSGRSSPEPISASASRSASPDKPAPRSDVEGAGVAMKLDQSDHDLTMRLELARRNSQNQHGKSVPTSTLQGPVEDTIYEEGPPLQLRPTSRASTVRDNASHLSSDSRHVSRSPARTLPVPSHLITQEPADARRFGPRSPSPLPPASPAPSSRRGLPSMDEEMDTESDAFQDADEPAPSKDSPSPLPRSKRQPFAPNSHVETTPKAVSGTPAPFSNIEPLSIKKKSSTRSGHSTYTPSRKYTRMSPLSKTTARIVSPRKVSPQTSKIPRPAPSSHAATEHVDRILQLMASSRDETESSHRAVKRMKFDLDELRSSSSSGPVDSWRSPSPEKSLARTPTITRTPTRTNPPLMTKEAQQRLEEMRQLIGKRQMEGTPRSRPRSLAAESPMPGASEPVNSAILARLEESLADADQHIVRTVSHHETLQSDLEQFMHDIKEKAVEYDKTRVELQNTKRQCELVKSLLADATAEKEIMYEAFNEELDAMYTDANLPHDEAWESMTKDLCQTKESRNGLSRENSELRRKVAELESEREEWAALLRAHGLIP